MGLYWKYRSQFLFDEGIFGIARGDVRFLAADCPRARILCTVLNVLMDGVLDKPVALTTCTKQ